MDLYKKLFLIFITIVLFDLHLLADNKISDPDSIIERYNITSVDYLLNVARDKKIHDFDSAESILLAANQLADSLKQTHNQVNALLLLGKLYFDNAYFENAEEIFNKILKEFREDITNEQYANVKHTLGLNHIRFNNYDKAINFIQEALSLL